MTTHQKLFSGYQGGISTDSILTRRDLEQVADTLRRLTASWGDVSKPGAGDDWVLLNGLGTLKKKISAAAWRLAAPAWSRNFRAGRSLWRACEREGG